MHLDFPSLLCSCYVLVKDRGERDEAERKKRAETESLVLGILSKLST